MEFERIERARRAQLQEDGEALAVPTTAETRMRSAPTLVVTNEEPEEVGAPNPGAMAIVALAAFGLSLVLSVCRLAGAPIGVLWILGPLWGSSLLVLGYTLIVALGVAFVDARAWVMRQGL